MLSFGPLTVVFEHWALGVEVYSGSGAVMADPMGDMNDALDALGDEMAEAFADVMGDLNEEDLAALAEEGDMESSEGDYDDFAQQGSAGGGGGGGGGGGSLEDTTEGKSRNQCCTLVVPSLIIIVWLQEPLVE